MRSLPQTLLSWCKAAALVLFLGLSLVACATGPRLVDHAFSFRAGDESPDVEVLDFRYGLERRAMASASLENVKNGRVQQNTSINGSFPLGDMLYVKWRIKSTSEVLENTVDLKSRLPRDISGHRIHFVVEGRELHVYLISPQLRPKDAPPFGPQFYRDYYKVYQIYPTSTLSQ